VRCYCQWVVSGVRKARSAFRLACDGSLPVGRGSEVQPVTETLLVGIAVLRNDRGDPLGMADSEPEACWCAVVKEVHRKPIEADDLAKSGRSRSAMLFGMCT